MFVYSDPEEGPRGPEKVEKKKNVQRYTNIARLFASNERV